VNAQKSGALAAVAVDEAMQPSSGGAPTRRLGPAETVLYDREPLSLQYLKDFGPFTGSYPQHSAALNYFREKMERLPPAHDWHYSLFSRDEAVAIAPGLLIKGQGWAFDRTQEVRWSWKEMVAQLEEDSMGIVVDGEGGRSGGLLGCYLAPRPNSYCQNRQPKWQEWQPLDEFESFAWDFLFERADGTSVRLHPLSTNTNVVRLEVVSLAVPEEPSAEGKGGSCGRWTYKHYKDIQPRAPLKFDANKVKGLPPGENT
jgi:hypothetical protein